MNQLKNELQNKISIPVSDEQSNTNSIGIVTTVNKSQNTCTVEFVNSYNGTQEAEGVPVRNDRNDNWFPSPGEPVRVMVNDAGACIIGTALDDTMLKAMRSISCEIFPASSKAKSYGRYLV